MTEIFDVYNVLRLYIYKQMQFFQVKEVNKLEEILKSEKVRFEDKRDKLMEVLRVFFGLEGLFRKVPRSLEEEVRERIGDTDTNFDWMFVVDGEVVAGIDKLPDESKARVYEGILNVCKNLNKFEVYYSMLSAFAKTDPMMKGLSRYARRVRDIVSLLLDRDNIKLELKERLMGEVNGLEQSDDVKLFMRFYEYTYMNSLSKNWRGDSSRVLSKIKDDFESISALKEVIESDDEFVHYMDVHGAIRELKYEIDKMEDNLRLVGELTILKFVNNVERSCEDKMFEVTVIGSNRSFFIKDPFDEGTYYRSMKYVWKNYSAFYEFLIKCGVKNRAEFEVLYKYIKSLKLEEVLK